MKRQRDYAEDDDDDPATLKSTYESGDETCLSSLVRYSNAKRRCGLDLSYISQIALKDVPLEEMGRSFASNNVLKGNLSCSVNTMKLAQCGLGSYDEGTFGACKMRFQEATLLVFPNGNMVVTGTSSISAAVLTIGQFRHILRKVSRRSHSVNGLRTCNVVCSMNFPFRLNLRFMHRRFSGWSKYDENLFPGLFLNFSRIGQGKDRNDTVGLLVFSSGKVAAAGLQPAKALTDPDFKNEREQMLDDLLAIMRQVVDPFFEK